MNRSIKGWFTAIMCTELVSAAFEILVLCGGIGSDLSTAYRNVCTMSIMFFAGVWFPILFGFVGKCIETKFKRLKAMPIAAAIPLVFSVFGIMWIQIHPRGFWAGPFHDLPRSLFYMLCGFISFFSLIFAIVHVCEIKKSKYAEFLAMPNELFEGKSVLLLIPLAALTLLCLIPAADGYIFSLH